MAYYFKIVVLSFVWKWKIEIMTHIFVSLWRSCNSNFSDCYSQVLLNHSQSRWVKTKLSLFLKRRSHCQNIPVTGKE